MDKICKGKVDLDSLNIHQLREYARAVGVYKPTVLRRADLIEQIGSIKDGTMKKTPASKRGRSPKPYVFVALENTIEEENMNQVGNNTLKNNNAILNDSCNDVGENEEVPETSMKGGFLEIQPNGNGFLRSNLYSSGGTIVNLTVSQVQNLKLRNADFVFGKADKRRGHWDMMHVDSINDMTVLDSFKRDDFECCIPDYPREKLKMETVSDVIATRFIDLLVPIGKGQRGLIVSPPKAGKTTMIKMIAKAINENNPKVQLVILLIDERPEEVTDIMQSVSATVVASTFDETAENHIEKAKYVLERAKRIVENGKDVCILLDSITRLARACNACVPSSGRSLSGGLDQAALNFPKKFFGAARNINGGGSLTIIATALVDTGSRMDDIIYEEFKGTGNMELHLDRYLSDRRIFPAIDLIKSGTRKDELLLTKGELDCNVFIRRLLSKGDNVRNTLSLIDMVDKTKNNDEFVEKLPEWNKLLK